MDCVDFYDQNMSGEIPLEIDNLTNLTHLRLGYNELTVEIPSEIGNLTNLTDLFLKNNQLSVIIPDQICNQGDNSSDLDLNQFCPQYPSCIEDYVKDQDTSNCGE